MALKIKTVESTTAAYGGGLVDAMPVKEVSGPTLTPGGLLADPLEVEEADDGVPVRFVDDDVAQNSVGAPVAVAPVTHAFANVEAAALVVRFTTPPTNARKALIDDLVGALKTAGVWSKLDALYVLAAADSQAARQNWVADAFNLTAVAAPTFTADRGYQGDGAASYLETGFNPTTAVTPKFVQDSGHMSFWSRTAGIFDGVDMGNGNSLLFLRPTGGSASHRINASASGTIAMADGSGHFVTSRTGSLAADNRLFRNAVNLMGANASAAPDNSSIRILGRSGGATSFSSRQGAAASIGSGLTAQQVTDFYNALNTYLHAVGAA